MDANDNHVMFQARKHLPTESKVSGNYDVALHVAPSKVYGI